MCICEINDSILYMKLILNAFYPPGSVKNMELSAFPYYSSFMMCILFSSCI